MSTTHFESTSTATSPTRARRTARPIAPERFEARLDDRLATRVFFGDLDAAAELRSRHEARLLDIALAIVEGEDEAEAVVEAAIEDACRRWPPTRGAVGPWLRALVRRRARALIRGVAECNA